MQLIIPGTEPSIDSVRVVPPVVPAIQNGLMIVGDLPYNEQAGEPFTNAHYGTLCGLSRKAGFDFHETIRTNVLPIFARNRKILPDHSSLCSKSMEEIERLASTNNVKLILLLGDQTLKWFKPNADYIDDERGAPFRWKGFVCISTLHPHELYIRYRYYRIVEADFAKAWRLCQEGWSEPEFKINYSPSFSECVDFLNRIVRERPYMSMDLETQENAEGKGYFTCCGFGLNGRTSFVIPFIREGNKPYFPENQEVIIWKLLARALETCRFLGQNAVHYDHWYAAYHSKILINVVDDAMFAFWELYCELEKSLAFQSSVLTDFPFHKDLLKAARSGKVARDQEFYYNGLDNCYNITCAQEIAKGMKELPEVVKSHYRFNIRRSRIFQYMSFRGARVDRDLLTHRIGVLEMEAQLLEDRLHSEANMKVNVNSPKQMLKWLYQDLGLPVKYRPVKDKDTGDVEDKETADFISLAYLARECPDVPGLMSAANLRKMKKRLSSLKAIKHGPNGEIYWNFNAVGTDSGRAAGYKPLNGMGVQPQNPDKRDRDLFLPPMVGQLWGKCDLEGADAWTVAGQLAVLGDDTMLKDLKAGLKPAMILALAREFGEHLINASQDVLSKLLKEQKGYFKTNPKGIQGYATAKAVSHGTNYMMQAKTMHMTIFKQSKAELYVPVRQCEQLRLLYLKRYRGLEFLYNHIPTMIERDGYLDAPSGMRRAFFGRPDNARTRVGLSFLPQNNTAYATDRALEKLFFCKFNRRPDGVALIVEPVNQVHDEADIAFYEDELTAAARIFKRAANLRSEIWGVEFQIPFDPNFGPNWGKCDNDLYDHL